MRKSIILILSGILFWSVSFGQEMTQAPEQRQGFVEKEPTFTAPVTFPNQVGWVNDFEKILSTEQQQLLDERIAQFEQNTSHEIVIVTVNDIAPYGDPAEYSINLGNQWGIGKVGQDNGLIILVSKSKRIVRISTGMGVEDVLTDDVCQKAVSEIMIPKFREGNFFEGINAGLSHLMERWTTLEQGE